MQLFFKFFILQTVDFLDSETDNLSHLMTSLNLSSGIYKRQQT